MSIMSIMSIMSTMPAMSTVLPIEIWHEIGRIDPETYFIMTCTCKSFKQDIDVMMKLFTFAKSWGHGIYTSILPNGNFHSIDDLPALSTVYVDEWFYNGMRHRPNDKPAVRRCGEEIVYKWYIHDVKYRPLGSQPCSIYIGEHEITKKWYQDGVKIRTSRLQNIPGGAVDLLY
jgi:hypothetical protein